MLGHVIYVVCALFLSEIGRHGNSEILRNQENLYNVLQQRNLIVFSRSREVCIRERPACSTNSQRLDTGDRRMFLLYKPCLALLRAMMYVLLHDAIHSVFPRVAAV